jgi:Ala-tRNA(Pro) deacylase
MSDTPDEDRPQDEAALLARLEALGIDWAYHAHPPLFTVEDSRALRGDLPGLHVKNMFLKEKKGGLWLVTCREDRRIRIRDLEREIGARNTSFGKPELLREALGVSPGAVTPFAAINDAEGRVRVVLDRAVLAAEIVNAHPLHNEATIAVSPQGLVRFLEDTGHTPLTVDFDALEARAAETGAAR